MSEPSKRTLRDLVRERHERGAAALGGRVRPDGQGGLVIDRYEQPAQPTATDGRQVRPANPSIFDRTDIEGD